MPFVKRETLKFSLSDAVKIYEHSMYKQRIKRYAIHMVCNNKGRLIARMTYMLQAQAKNVPLIRYSRISPTRKGGFR